MLTHSSTGRVPVPIHGYETSAAMQGDAYRLLLEHSQEFATGSSDHLGSSRHLKITSELAKTLDARL